MLTTTQKADLLDKIAKETNLDQNNLKAEIDDLIIMVMNHKEFNGLMENFASVLGFPSRVGYLDSLRCLLVQLRDSNFKMSKEKANALSTGSGCKIGKR